MRKNGKNLGGGIAYQLYMGILQFLNILGRYFSITAALSWARGTSRCTVNGFASATETRNIGFLIHVIEKQISHICEKKTDSQKPYS